MAQLKIQKREIQKTEIDQVYKERGEYLKAQFDDAFFGEAKGDNHPMLLLYYKMMAQLAQINGK